MAIEWYLYGGYKLPKFPEIEGHPYQILVYADWMSSYYMNYSDKPFYYDDSKKQCFCLETYSHYDLGLSKSQLDSWGVGSSHNSPTQHWRNSGTAVTGSSDVILWSNFDICSISDRTTVVYQGSEALLWDSVNGITITSTDSIQRGLFISISATVTGNGDFNKDYTVSLSGQSTSTNPLDVTTLYRNVSGNSTTYQLYCSKTEEAETLTITATSVANPSVSVSKTIAVIGVNSQPDTMLIQKQTLINIADAIRNKNKTTKTYSPFEMIQGIEEIQTGCELEELANPATAQQILSGYEAYNSNGEKISGSAFLTGGYVEVKLLANNWNGTTQTVSIKNFRIADGQTPLMDLPYNSSAPNAIRVVKAAITMPSIDTVSSTADGVTSYTTTCIFSAVTTPPVDVVVAIFNITEVAI